MLYTRQQLINEWKMRTGLEPLRVDATIQRYDAFEVDEYAARMVDDWYIRLLDKGDISLLEPVDITADVSVDSFEGGVACILLPDTCRRLVSVTDAVWHRAATITTAGTRLARLQDSVFSRGGPDSPVATQHPDRTLRLYSYPPGSSPHLCRVKAVVHIPGEYRFNSAALALMPALTSLHTT